MPHKRVFCADDNEDTCLMLAALLAREGWEVRSADSISAALALAEAERFDLYLLDNIFPDGSGVELCRRLAQLHPDVPVMFYSGAAFEADREEAMSAGARAYVTKPHIDRLLKAVWLLLGAGEMEEAGRGAADGE